MNNYLALLTVFIISQVVSTVSFIPTNPKLCSRDNCGLGISEYMEPTPKLKKIIKDLLKKSEKIKNILIYPEPEDKEDWESGEIPWEPRNITEIYEVKNATIVQHGESYNSLSSYNLGMLFA